MQKEVVAAETHQDPVVSGVLEDVEEWHRVVGESVDEESLELSLDVVPKDHNETNFLTEIVRFRFTIDLLLEQS